jgi:hypothetical protein
MVVSESETNTFICMDIIILVMVDQNEGSLDESKLFFSHLEWS